MIQSHVTHDGEPRVCHIHAKAMDMAEPDIGRADLFSEAIRNAGSLTLQRSCGRAKPARRKTSKLANDSDILQWRNMR